MSSVEAIPFEVKERLNEWFGTDKYHIVDFTYRKPTWWSSWYIVTCDEFGSIRCFLIEWNFSDETILTLQARFDYGGTE